MQDQWHLRSNVTLNLGVRYEVQFPIVPTSAVYSQSTLADVCGQAGTGTTNPAAVEAVKIGLPCQFGVPGFQTGITPYVYTLADVGTNASSTATAATVGLGSVGVPSDVGTTKCIAPRTNTASKTAFSATAPCPIYTPYTPGTSGWKTDWNNFAPASAWRGSPTCSTASAASPG